MLLGTFKMGMQRSSSTTSTMGPGDGSLDLRTPGTPRMRMGTTRATSTPGTTTSSHITTAQTRHTGE